MHLLTRTTNEKGIARKHGLVTAILQIEANAVLSMAGCVDSLERDIAKLKRLTMLGGLGDAITILASDDVQCWSTKLRKLPAD